MELHALFCTEIITTIAKGIILLYKIVSRSAFLRAILFAVFASVTLLPALPVNAESIAEKLPFKATFQQSDPIVIPVTAQPGKTELSFPAPMMEKQGVLCVKFRAFLNTPAPDGWSHYLKLTLNGKELTPEMPDASARLLNRGKVCDTTIEGKVAWWNRDRLLTFFGPEGRLDERVISPREEGYWYVLNISDAANFTKLGLDDRIEGGTPNRLVIENFFGDSGMSREMIVKDLSIGYIPQAELDKFNTGSTMPFPNVVGKTLTGQGCSLTVAASGAMNVKIGHDDYALSSAYSYPGNVIGFNRFSWFGESAPEWRTIMESNRVPGRISLKGIAKGYTVNRTIDIKDGKFYIKDTIENTTDAPLGMNVRYQAVAQMPFSSGQTTICGVPDAAQASSCAANPTMFIRQAESSLGIVCEDTLFRMQLGIERVRNSMQFGTEHFGLKPHERHTFEWTMYPSKDMDYFGFINSVRKEWNVNYTIPGPGGFSKAAVPNRKMKVYMISPWFMYANGTNLSREQFRELQKTQIAKIIAVEPDAIPVGMLETNLIPVKTSDVKGLETGLTPQTYGVEASEVQTDGLKALPWFDSMIKTADGRPYLDTIYANKPYCDLMVYPVVGNYQYKYLLDQIDYLMDKVGFKGIYLDQFNLSMTASAMGRADYSKWDGYTVDLDSQGRIARKYTDGALVGTNARLEIIEHVQKKGGILVTNGHSYARETTGKDVLAFAETEWDINTGQEVLNWNEPPALPAIAEAHLDSPIGLGIRPARFANFGSDHAAELIHKWVITLLKNGILYYYYQDTIPETGPGAGEYGELNHMFPFTPVELHAGWLVGQERIITAKSGTFIWDHKDKPAVLVFDIKGKAKTADVLITQYYQGWQVKIKMADWQETAIIESTSSNH